MKTLFTFLLCLLPLLSSLQAQVAVEVTPPNYIRTVIFNSGSGYSGTPIIRIGERLNLEFDDIIGDEANYYYTIQHYNYDWTPSQLVKSEYLEGLDNVRITEYQNSYNTLQLYSHYSLQIPNEDTRGLKVSGNYMLKIFNEARELIFSRKFMVYEPLTSVVVEIKKSREVKLIHTKQVVNFSVDSPDFIIRNPEESVYAVILQNNNLKTGIYNIKPQYNIGSELIYKYDQLTSFWAGNEYLNFDSKDLRAATVKIQAIEVRDLYHHFLFTDRIRAFEPYTYNPDINGKFVVRTMQGRDPDIEAGYVWTHFALRTPEPLEGGEVHLYGEFNHFNLDDSTRLTYNFETGRYETARLFKQGYYDYKYVFLRDDGVLDEGFISGNFISTENEYTVLIYYLPPGARYARIIGVGSANSIDISN
ncbi:DUF5103 domain-containing protein [Salinimicrobium catena]|uniref:type IX secretion system plug protein n=1 Tax=Salinimicrobium catena TaxID=390640 RepID=UPI002FE4C8BE